MSGVICLIILFSMVGLLYRPTARRPARRSRRYDPADYDTPEWAALVRLVHRRDGYRCHFCKGEVHKWDTAHHVTYREGVLCDPRWLLSTCWPCHDYIHYR